MDEKISSLSELTAPDSLDELAIVDKSDTTMDVTGTDKKITRKTLTPEHTVETTTVGESIALYEGTDNGTNKVTLKAPDSIASDKTITLPDETGTAATQEYVASELASFVSQDIAPQNLLKNGNFINNATNGYGSTPDDWASSNANPVQGGIPALTKQNLIDGLGVADGDIEGLWNLNGNFNDLSSNGYNLTPSGSPTDDSNGLMALAKKFVSASSQYASNAAANCRIAGNQTIIAFIKPASFPTASTRICGCAESGAANYSVIQLDNGTYYPTFAITGITTNGTNRIFSTVKLEVGKWNMIVGILDQSNSKIKVWVNGIKTEQSFTGTHTAGTGGFSVGRLGDIVEASGYFDGLIQNVSMLSVALTDNQVKKLFAETLYKGIKVRRATTNAIAYQDLPMDLVERLRGKTVALRADLYQEVASTAQISILQTLASGSTSETIISATDATTGSWIEKVATGAIDATAVGIRIQLKHSTSDGNTWFKNVSLYEGSILLPYDHSKDDWSRFPRLLKMDIPAVISGYQFEEGRRFSWTPTLTPTGSMTYGSTSINWSTFMLLAKTCYLDFRYIGTVGGTPSYGISFTLPVVAKNSEGVNFGGNYFNGSSTIGGLTVGVSTTQAQSNRYDGGNLTAGANQRMASNGGYEID